MGQKNRQLFSLILSGHAQNEEFLDTNTDYRVLEIIAREKLKTASELTYCQLYCPHKKLFLQFCKSFHGKIVRRNCNRCSKCKL